MATYEEDATKNYVPSKTLDSAYPLIDCDPHISRVYGYSRPTDWLLAAGIAAIAPVGMWVMERVQPARVSPGGFPRIMRLNIALGLGAGLLTVGQQSSYRFYGLNENKREQEMDMREMVDKIKKGKPLYGESTMTPYMQGVAARNSRYSGVWLYVIPWFNFANHNQHGVDTAKYYRQAERELEAERTA